MRDMVGTMARHNDIDHNHDNGKDDGDNEDGDRGKKRDQECAGAEDTIIDLAERALCDLRSREERLREKLGVGG